MMNVTARLTITGAAALLIVCLSCSAMLHAQEITELTDSSGQSSTPASVTEKVSDAIEGIKSGDISAAKEAVVFDKLLSYTLIRISDCWTLCKQEMILAKECARQETIQTAKDIFQKGKDAAVEQTREAILETLPPLLGGKAETDDLSSNLNGTSAKPDESALPPDPTSVPEL